LLQAEALKYQNRSAASQVRHGEIVGLRVCSALAKRNGARSVRGRTTDGGTVKPKVAFSPLRGPHDAIDGMAFSEDRKADGIIPELSVRENLTLAALPDLTQWGIVSRKRQGELVDRFMQRLGIKAERRAEDPRTRAASAEGPSGAMAVQEYETSLLDEPTAVSTFAVGRSNGSSLNWRAGWGSDVHRKWKSSLKAHSVSSSLRDGRSVAELSGEQKNIKAILHAMAEGADRGSWIV